jgi:hypothetical protein
VLGYVDLVGTGIILVLIKSDKALKIVVPIIIILDKLIVACSTILVFKKPVANLLSTSEI